MIHDSFAAWVEAEVLPKGASQERLDGRKSGGNQAAYGRFKHHGRTWKVKGDTRIERIRRAYEAMQSGKFPDPFVVEPAEVGDGLNLVEAIREPKGPKHFFVYEVV